MKFSLTYPNYWTSTPWDENISQYWFISITTAQGESADLDTVKYFRCVSGTERTANFTNNGDRTVTDSTNNLIWEK